MILTSLSILIKTFNWSKSRGKLLWWRTMMLFAFCLVDYSWSSNRFEFFIVNYSYPLKCIKKRVNDSYLGSFPRSAIFSGMHTPFLLYMYWFVEILHSYCYLKLNILECTHWAKKFEQNRQSLLLIVCQNSENLINISSQKRIWDDYDVGVDMSYGFVSSSSCKTSFTKLEEPKIIWALLRGKHLEWPPPPTHTQTQTQHVPSKPRPLSSYMIAWEYPIQCGWVGHNGRMYYWSNIGKVTYPIFGQP